MNVSTTGLVLGVVLAITKLFGLLLVIGFLTGFLVAVF